MTAQPKTVYNAKRSQLIHGDATVAMQSMLDAKRHFRLVFLDPPFNYGREYDKDETRDKLPPDEYYALMRTWAFLACHLTHPDGGVQVWNLPWQHASHIVHHIDEVIGNHVSMRGRHVKLHTYAMWFYRFGINMTGRFCPSHTHVPIFVRGQDQPSRWNWKDILVDSDRVALGDKRTLTKKDGAPPGKRVPRDVWEGPGFARVTGNSGERRPGHDNQLPEAYMERLIRAYTNKGDAVLDVFGGSGTGMAVGKRLDRHVTSVEQSLKNCRSIVERVKAVGTGG